ncbi:MAG: hypothetical protein ING40_09185 [Burkholderiales bacterium]|jgi:hypothetical protein|nr:hypothetical protein [Burkholderiales bacterium]
MKQVKAMESVQGWLKSTRNVLQAAVEMLRSRPNCAEPRAPAPAGRDVADGSVATGRVEARQTFGLLRRQSAADVLD